MDPYEELMCNVVLNAGEKLMDAANLYNTNYSYRSALFLTIVAEEELAKIILIPFANYADNLGELLKRPSVYYKHPVKQKLFTSYGLQNRSHTDIEETKQQCLYVGPLSNGKNGVKHILQKDVLDELVHAIELFNQLVIRNTLSPQVMSSKYKSIVSTYISKIFVPAINDLLPDVATKVREDLRAKSPPSSSIIEVVETCPLIFAEMITYALPNDYKRFFTEIQTLSQNEMMDRLAEYP